MRISDWSSDVCSSDLRHPLRRLCLKRAPGHQRYEMKVEIIIAAILLVLCDGALAQTACPQGVAAGSAQCGPSSLVNPNDSGNRPEASPLPQVKWADKIGRAQSALQSLMRISYAVFCLKKKKNNTNTK